MRDSLRVFERHYAHDERHEQREARHRGQRHAAVRGQHAGELREERQGDGHEHEGQPRARKEAEQVRPRVLDDEHARQHGAGHAERFERAVVGVVLLDGRRHGVRADDERDDEQEQREHPAYRRADDHHHHGVARKRRGAEQARGGLAPGRFLGDDAREVVRPQPGGARLLGEVDVHLDDAVRLLLRGEHVGRRPRFEGERVDVVAHAFDVAGREQAALDLHERRSQLRVLEERRDGERARLIADQQVHRVADVHPRRRSPRGGRVQLSGTRGCGVLHERPAVVGEHPVGQAGTPCFEHVRRRGVLVEVAACMVELRGNAQRVVRPRVAHLVDGAHVVHHLVGEVPRHVVHVHVARARFRERLGFARVQIHVHADGEAQRRRGERHEEEQSQKRAFAAFDAGFRQRAHERHGAPPTTTATRARRSPAPRAPSPWPPRRPSTRAAPARPRRRRPRGTARGSRARRSARRE